MDAIRKRASREEWRKRVERWRDSGLTAAQFATETGINPRTLTFWSSALRKEKRGGDTPSASKRKRAVDTVHAAAPTGDPLALVELRPRPVMAGFELELPHGRRLRIADNFDSESLGRLLAVLGAR